MNRVGVPVGTLHRGKKEEEGGERRGEGSGGEGRRRLWQVYLAEHLRYVSAEP